MAISDSNWILITHDWGINSYMKEQNSSVSTNWHLTTVVVLSTKKPEWCSQYSD